jgi:DNA-binding CsgD family transcriptional regulator
LDTDEQRVFRWLAIFKGGCTLEAAEAVCNGDLASTRPILDILIPLVDKNLLRSDQIHGEPRFSLLRTIQEYALDQLEGNGEVQKVCKRHADYYLDLAERAERELKGPDQIMWLERLENEHGNLGAALGWSIKQSEVGTAFRLGGALWRFWLNRGFLNEGRQWLDRILSIEKKVSTDSKISVLNGAGALAWAQGDYDISREFHTECLFLRKMVEDEAGIAASLHNLGIIALFQDDYETALSNFQESVTIYRELGDQWGAADGLLQVGAVLRNQKDFEGARQYTNQGLEMLRELGDMQGIAGSLHLLGMIALDQVSHEQARQYFTESKSLFTELGDRWGIAVSDYNLGMIALHRGDLQQAETFFIDSLNLKNDLGDKQGIAYGLEGLAYLAAARSAMQKAARLWGVAEGLRNSIGTFLNDSEQADRERYLKAARSQLRGKAFLIEKEAGAAMSLEQAIRYAQESLENGEKSRAAKTSRRSLPAGLTPREVEVLHLVAQGLSDAEVAERLVLSPRTVNAHLTSIYRKLGVNSRAAATRFAVEQNLG